MNEPLTTPFSDPPRREGNSPAPRNTQKVVADEPFDSSTQTGTAEEVHRFGGAMRRMPTDYQAVIKLINFERKSREEASQTLNCSPEETEKLWLQAFSRLQIELGLSTQTGQGSEVASHGPAIADSPAAPRPDAQRSPESESFPRSPMPASPDFEAWLSEGPSSAKECWRLIERVRVYREGAAPEHLLDGLWALPGDDGSAEVFPHQLGRFELLRELGRGGHGIVYLANDPNLKREIALKIPRPDLLQSRSVRRRFVHEAQAAAKLDHRNIVRVLEAGFDGPFCYIVEELCDGPSLAAWLRGRREPLVPQVAGWIAKELTDALAHAHQRMILHRDVKPANVLLKPLTDRESNEQETATRTDGSPPFTPKLCDFGICKAFDEDDARTATQTDTVVGTAAYMSPEQATGQVSEIGPGADVYGVGAILYEMLAGFPPIRGSSRADILRRVLTDEPTPLRRVRPDVPRDLELICLKCLAKEPAGRYSTAESLAADLGHFLAGEPISVRSVRPWERAWLWSRRHPLQAASGLLVVFLFCAWILTVTAANIGLSRLNETLEAANAQLIKAGIDKDAAATQARELQEAAERDRAKADELLYVSDMQQAGMALRSGDVRRLMRVLERHASQARTTPYQGGEWDFLWRHGQVPHRLIANSPQPIYFVCPSPDERYLAATGKDAVIRIYDSASSKLVFSIQTGQLEANGLAFSPNGDTLASAGDDGTIALWRIDWKRGEAQHIRSIKAHPFQVFNILYTPDGRTLISAGRDTVIRLRNAATGKSAGALEGHGDTAGSIALEPGGKWLATAASDGEVIEWDLASHKIIHRIHVGVPLLCIAFSSDGRLFAAGTSEGDIRIWRTPAWEPAKKIELLDRADRVAFLNGDASVVACDSSGSIHVRSTEAEDPAPGTAIASGATSRAWSAHHTQIFALLPLRKSQELVTAGKDGSVIAWNLQSNPDAWDLRDPQAEVEDIQFLPGSNQLAVCNATTISIWDPVLRTCTRTLGKSTTTILCLCVSRDGSTVATGALGGAVRVYRLSEGARERKWMLGPAFNVHRIAVSPDGRLIAAVDRYNSNKRDDLYVMDAQTGKRLENIRANECNCAAFSTDGQWLLASGPANVVTVWNVRSQQKVSEQPGHDSSINCIAFHPREKWVATASDDRLLKIWSTEDWRLKFSLHGAHRPLTATAISADGRTLATSGQRGVLTFWHAAGENDLFQPLINVDFSPAYPERISFSSDGSLIASVLNDPTSRLPKRFVRIMKWQSETASSPQVSFGRHAPDNRIVTPTNR